MTDTSKNLPSGLRELPSAADTQTLINLNTLYDSLKDRAHAALRKSFESHDYEKAIGIHFPRSYSSMYEHSAKLPYPELLQSIWERMEKSIAFIDSNDTPFTCAPIAAANQETPDHQKPFVFPKRVNGILKNCSIIVDVPSNFSRDYFLMALNKAAEVNVQDKKHYAPLTKEQIKRADIDNNDAKTMSGDMVWHRITIPLYPLTQLFGLAQQPQQQADKDSSPRR